MKSKQQDTKMEERLLESVFREEKPSPSGFADIFIGLAMGAVFIGIIWTLYNNDEYRDIKDIDKDRILILCEDDSTEWFNLPSCIGPDKKLPKCEEKISSSCPKCPAVKKCRPCASVKGAWDACETIRHSIAYMPGSIPYFAGDYLVDCCGLTLREVKDLISEADKF